MAVTTVYGMTESGKSYFTQNNYMKKYDRVIVFDFMNCFSGGDVVFLKDASDAQKILKKFYKKDSYKIIIRVSRNANARFLCDLAISLSCALGRTLKNGKRLLFVIDEADKVVTSHFQSKRVKHLVNVGRHDNVDSLFIARNPTRLHTDIRVNASEIICFRLPLAASVKDFVNNFGKTNCNRIKNLEKYNCFYWNDTGQVKILNSKGVVTWQE